jgi:hypothetical protein
MPAASIEVPSSSTSSSPTISYIVPNYSHLSDEEKRNKNVTLIDKLKVLVNSEKFDTFRAISLQYRNGDVEASIYYDIFLKVSALTCV